MNNVFDEGAQAYWDGLSLKKNPYSLAEVPQHFQWIDGWKAAKKEVMNVEDDEA